MIKLKLTACFLCFYIFGCSNSPEIVESPNMGEVEIGEPEGFTLYPVTFAATFADSKAAVGYCDTQNFGTVYREYSDDPDYLVWMCIDDGVSSAPIGGVSESDKQVFLGIFSYGKDFLEYGTVSITQTQEDDLVVSCNGTANSGWNNTRVMPIDKLMETNAGIVLVSTSKPFYPCGIPEVTLPSLSDLSSVLVDIDRFRTTLPLTKIK